jgi:hypothetical protein
MHEQTKIQLTYLELNLHNHSFININSLLKSVRFYRICNGRHYIAKIGVEFTETFFRKPRFSCKDGMFLFYFICHGLHYIA